jgi:uncharacterized protein (TIGR03437 family)
MPSIRTVFVCLGLLLAHLSQLGAEDRLFLFSAGSAQISVLNASSLTSAGSIDLPSGAFAVLAPPDASKYYVVRANPTDTVAVVDPVTLAVTKTISLGTNASDAVITPDGKYLLVSAGRLRVIGTATDEEIIQPIATGTAPTQILVNNVSSRAYVLSSSGHSLHLIDLDTLTVMKGISGETVGTLNSIALTDDDSRLVAAATDGLRQFSARDLQFLSTTSWGPYTVVRGRVQLVPGSGFAFVENGGSPPNVTSLLLNLDDQQIRPLGDIGSTRLAQITVVDATTAYAMASGNGLVKIDFTDPKAPTIQPVLAGLNANSLSLSPNRRFLFASSSGDARVSRVELETPTITHAVVAPVSPVSHASLFDPVAGPPAKLIVNGGDNQAVAPERVLPVELSIRALAADGSPVVGQPILFTVDGAVPLQFEPADLVTTNQRGVAAVRVTVPALAVMDAAKAALAPSAATVALAGDSPPTSEQTTEPDPIRRVSVTASAGGVTAVGLTVNIVTQVGLVKLSGDHQIVALGQPFPLPMVMLATDPEGDPLPVGTPINITVPGAYAACDSPAEVDATGLATTQCFSTLAGGNQNAVRFGFILADATLAAPELDRDIGQENFSYNIAINPRLSVEKISGDLQTAPSGTTLSQPLRFRVNNNSGIQIIGQGGIGVNIRHVSGPPVTVEPRFLVASPGASQSVTVTLGPGAGSSIVEVQSSSPGLNSARFTVNATGGQPQRIEKLGDNQTAQTNSELPTPLQVQVFNESNQPVSFPQVTWTVLEGDASIVASTTATSGMARVLIGPTPGTIRIQARAGSLVTTFVIAASPPQPVSISPTAGQSQTLTSGVLSEPLTVVVNEASNQPARGVTVTFSGPPNVVLHALQGDSSGNPLQQVTDANGAAGVRVELVASAALSASPEQFSNAITITASVGENLAAAFVLNVVGRTPAFTVNGVINAASFQPGVVPGSLATIFGTGLSEGVSGTVFVGGETAFGGTIVRFGDFQAPLISITGPPDEQINVQVPFELSAGISTTVQVQNNGSSLAIGGVASFASQPGIFTVPIDETTSVGAVIHAATGELVTPDNPAERGEIVAMFITGGGQVSPAVQSGVPAPPGLPPIMILPVTVGVDNKGSTPQFAGYAPGFIGLYQINFPIPSDAACGLVPLNVRVGTVVSPRTNTAVLCPE